MYSWSQGNWRRALNELIHSSGAAAESIQFCKPAFSLEKDRLSRSRKLPPFLSRGRSREWNRAYALARSLLIFASKACEACKWWQSMNCSIRPPSNTPNNLGPQPRSDNSRHTKDWTREEFRWKIVETASASLLPPYLLKTRLPCESWQFPSPWVINLSTLYVSLISPFLQASSY